jgi:hypothetical protein
VLKKLTTKAWWALAGLALLAVLLVACGGGEKSAPGPTATGGGGPQGTRSASPTVARTPTAMTPTVQTPSPVVPSTPTAAGAEMGVDAIVGGAVDASRTVTDANPFEVDVVVVNAGPGYQGYQFKVQWDAAVLAYDSQANLMPEELNLCATPTVIENTMFVGCARVQGNTSFQGPLNRLTFHCVAPGTSTLHLLTPSEISALASTLLGYTGVTIPTQVVDASVTCAG